MLANLHVLLSDQKGVHKSSALLWVQSLFQLSEKLRVLFPIEGEALVDFSSVESPFADPWEHVVKLSKKQEMI